MKKIFSFSNLTLLVALCLSSVAAWYSIIGLTAIFAGAVIPVIIMGSILEVGKITTTVWLRKYWHRAGFLLKLYLVPAVIALALLTSMGIFGFLSKAHMEHGISTGDSQAKLSLYDEKIKTQRDNIELARKALTQMDNQVDQRLSRGDSENSAERAVQIRRQQTGERTKLQKEIGDAQKEIAKLNEERAPIAAENRKIEAEVGPIKYIAALIYGDNADNNTLESAVRWVIILLVIVFDPLAIALVLAANASKEWDDEEPVKEEPKYEQDDGPLTDQQIDQIKETTSEPDIEEGNKLIDEIEKEVPEYIIPKEPIEVEEPVIEVKEEKSILEQHPYLSQPFSHFSNLKPMVYKPEVKEEPVVEKPIEAIVEPVNITAAELEETTSSNVKIPAETGYKETENGYVIYEGKMFSKDALKEIKPELFRLVVDKTIQNTTNFGTQFPKTANKGDTFVRVDVLPNRVFKFDSKRWFEVNKETVDAYLYDENYIKHLVAKIDSGEYDIELLSDKEKEQIESYLNSNKP